MTLTEMSQLALIIGTALSFLTTVGTLYVLMKTLELNQKGIALTRQAKQSDILFHCSERYGRILELRALEDVKADPLTFYERYWTLQLDQFTHWKQGFLDPEVYKSWLEERYDQWQRDALFGAMPYQEGYRRAAANLNAPLFKSFMFEVHTHGVEAAMTWWKQRSPNYAGLMAQTNT